MPTELWLAYCAYLIWLTAGLADFVCHWRTDLPHTSGVAESVMHLLQLGLLGLGVLLGLAFEVGRSIALLLFALVVVHAVVGYVDTRIAFARQRVVRPVEQHLHSVLDMAPIIAFAWVIITTWPMAIGADGSLQARQPMLSGGVWLAVLGPPMVLCVAPAVLEFRAAWKVGRRA